jgi:protein O-GlcNAc transferase
MNRKERRTTKSRGGSQTDHPLYGLYLEAVEYHKARKLVEAEQRYRQILTLDPQHAETLHMMGLLAHELGRNDIAEELIRKAIGLQDKNFAFHFGLGNVLGKLGKHNDAIDSYKKSIALNPDFAGSYNNIGVTLLSMKSAEEALVYFKKAQTIDPKFPDSLNNIGLALQTQGKSDEATEYYKRAVAIDPNFVEALNNLGANLRKKGKLHEAVSCYRKGLAAQPNSLEILGNFSTSLRECGELNEAIIYLKRAVSLQPSANNYSVLLMGMIYASSVTPEELADTARAFGEKITPPQPDEKFSDHNNDSQRKLRIGYVSPDFCNHVVNFFFEPLLTNHDRNNFEIFAYSNNVSDDSITARLKEKFDHWRTITTMTDDQAANAIENDQIDILIDLTGHTANNRLPVFARKPAPIQATWLGYPATTGLTSIDYKITDRLAEPEGMTEHLNTEKLWRLPDFFCCYRPHVARPEAIDHPPFEDNGYITFGCFNNFVKVTDPVLEAWARIMENIPDARLMLEIHMIDNPELHEDVEKRMTRFGIPMDRVILEPRKPSNQYTLYNKIDIALDPFPCVGGTTSMDTLWMGVPLITLAGRHFTSRMGVSILTNAGLPELIAHNTDEYVKMATDLALDHDRLRRIRHNLRDRVEASPLMNQEAFTRNMEKAYRQMWEIWCKKKSME